MKGKKIAPSTEKQFPILTSPLPQIHTDRNHSDMRAHVSIKQCQCHLAWSFLGVSLPWLSYGNCSITQGHMSTKTHESIVTGWTRAVLGRGLIWKHFGEICSCELNKKIKCLESPMVTITRVRHPTNRLKQRNVFFTLGFCSNWANETKCVNYSGVKVVEGKVWLWTEPR